MPEVQLHALNLFKIKTQPLFLSAIINITVKNMKSGRVPPKEADIVNSTLIHCSIFQWVFFLLNAPRNIEHTHKELHCMRAAK